MRHPSFFWALFFVIARVSLACLGCVVIALKTVPACQMRVPSCGRWIFCRKKTFCCPVVRSSLFVVVSCIVMVPRSRMRTGHGYLRTLRVAAKPGN